VSLTPLSALGQNSKRMQLVRTLAAEVRELTAGLALAPDAAAAAAAAAAAGNSAAAVDNNSAANEGLASSRLPDDGAAALDELLEHVREANTARAAEQKRRDEAGAALAASAQQAEQQLTAELEASAQLATELAASKEQVAQLEHAVEESGSVLEQAVEIAMQEGFQQDGPDHHPSAMRNRAPIADAMRSLFPQDTSGLALEIGSGTGAHLEILAADYPQLQWRPS
jgi:hypothetical protein